MSGSVTDKKRLLRVTAGSVRNCYISVAGHYDFFPSNCVSSTSSSVNGNGRRQPIQITLDGLDKTIETSIAWDSRTGKPRGCLRERAAVRQFFEHHGVVAGDTLFLERHGNNQYRVGVARSREDAAGARTFLEFFAGIGLVRMGLERAGWKIAFANDIDQQKREMYDTHFGDAAQHYDVSDIHTLDPEAIPTATLATASFPCTDLSLAGGREGLAGKQSSAFFGFIRALDGMGSRRPSLVLLENVLGFLTSHAGHDFEEAMLALNSLGYSVDPFVLDARRFVPQSRPRLFVVGSLRNTPTDAPTWKLATSLRPRAVSEFIHAHPNIRWAHYSLPDPPTVSGQRLRDILDDLPEHSPEWWNKERAEYLYNQMSPRHRAVADEWIGKKRWSYGAVFRRVRLQPDGKKRSMAELRSDGFAGCLRTPKGGSGRQILFKAGYGRYAARLLTPAECARLMGADGFRVNAPLNQALFGFGDAVCVPAVEWIARHYLAPVAAGATTEHLAR